MNNKCDGCKFYCNGRCFGEKNAPYVEYADCKGENNRPDTISNERAKEIIDYLKSIRTLFEVTYDSFNDIWNDVCLFFMYFNYYEVTYETYNRYT